MEVSSIYPPTHCPLAQCYGSRLARKDLHRWPHLSGQIVIEFGACSCSRYAASFRSIMSVQKMEIAFKFSSLPNMAWIKAGSEISGSKTAVKAARSSVYSGQTARVYSVPCPWHRRRTSTQHRQQPKQLCLVKICTERNVIAPCLLSTQQLLQAGPNCCHQLPACFWVLETTFRPPLRTPPSCTR